MNTTEIKEEINRVIDSIPDEALEPVLQYLKSLQNIPTATINRSHLLSKILSEDKGLLERLAQ